MEAAKIVKVEGGENDLLERIAADSMFGVSLEELQALLKPEKYVGRAPEQTADYLHEIVEPLLARYGDASEEKDEIEV